jgi:hypothetical protein
MMAAISAAPEQFPTILQTYIIVLLLLYNTQQNKVNCPVHTTAL